MKQTGGSFDSGCSLEDVAPPRSLVPTGQLRWQRRTVPAPEFGHGVGKGQLFLQQGYSDPRSGELVWIDVPEVERET